MVSKIYLKLKEKDVELGGSHILSFQKEFEDFDEAKEFFKKNDDYDKTFAFTKSKKVEKFNEDEVHEIADDAVECQFYLSSDGWYYRALDTQDNRFQHI